MDVFVWLITMLLPVMIFVMGLVFKLSPPRRINFLYGIRTQRSMASQEAWDAAHRMGGQLWSVTGAALAVLAAGALLVFGADIAVMFAVYGASFIGLFVPLGVIQHRLKRMFDERRQPLD